MHSWKAQFDEHMETWRPSLRESGHINNTVIYRLLLQITQSRFVILSENLDTGR